MLECSKIGKSGLNSWMLNQKSKLLDLKENKKNVHNKLRTS